jgi:hypothetical protein
MRKTLNNQVYDFLTRSEEDWTFDSYYAYHKPSNSKFWICNGIMFFSQDASNGYVGMGFINKVRLWFWLKKCAKIKFINTRY